jgi:hypothetical protein
MKSNTMDNPTTEQIKEVIAEVVKENLTTAEPETEILEEGIVEFTTAGEYINSAYFALSAVSDMDFDMINAMSNADGRRIKRIKRKSLKIIDICITEMYDELFDNDEED